MELSRKIKIALRFSLVSAGAIALFWACWYLIAGSVPEVSQIKLNEKTTIELGFSISRWWDVLIGPIWSVFLTLAFANKKIMSDANLAASLALGLVFGFAFSLIFGLNLAIDGGLILSLVVALIAALVTGFDRNFDGGLVTGLCTSLGGGLGVGLGFGLIFGLSIGLSVALGGCLAVSLAVALIFGLVNGFKIAFVPLVIAILNVFSLSFWKNIGDWLIAKP